MAYFGDLDKDMRKYADLIRQERIWNMQPYNSNSANLNPLNALIGTAGAEQKIEDIYNLYQTINLPTLYNSPTIDNSLEQVPVKFITPTEAIELLDSMGVSLV